jgi:hypothetical protein
VCFVERSYHAAVGYSRSKLGAGVGNGTLRGVLDADVFHAPDDPSSTKEPPEEMVETLLTPLCWCAVLYNGLLLFNVRFSLPFWSRQSWSFTEEGLRVRSV